jgi:hypothetical protein
MDEKLPSGRRWPGERLMAKRVRPLLIKLGNFKFPRFKLRGDQRHWVLFHNRFKRFSIGQMTRGRPLLNRARLSDCQISEVFGRPNPLL